MNLIFGASGHATEIEWLTQICVAPTGQAFRADHFVVEDRCIQAQHAGLPVLTETQVLQRGGPFNGFIALGEPSLRQKIWRRFDQPLASWPTLVHPDVIFDRRPGRVSMEQGCIIFPGCTLTSQIALGRHVHLNVGCSISHDVHIADFCTLSPGVHLAGKVSLAQRVFLGIGAVVIENIHICADAIIGAGSVVVRDIVEAGTYVGVPAKKIK